MAYKKSGGSILATTLFADLTMESLVKGFADEDIKKRVEDQKEKDRLSSLLVHQKAFLEDKTTRHLGLVAGFGSGKSYSLTVKMLQLAYDNAGYTGIALEPTYGMLSDILIPQLQELWDGWGVNYQLYRGAAEIKVKCPGGETSTILLRSFENYTRLRGVNAAWAVVDEIDTVKPKIANVAFQLLQGRIRSGCMPQIAVCSTPEGFGWLYNFFIKADDDSKRLIKAKTTDNPWLPPEYIASLREQYPPGLIEAYLNGEFCNLAQSSIFPEFDRKRNCSDVIVEPSDTILVGIDFNINQCHFCAGVMRQELGQDVLHVVASFVERDTYAIVTRLQQVFGNQILANRVICFPDAAGQAQSTASTRTDHQILREGSLVVRPERRNPDVQESIAHVNALLHRGRLKVAVDRAPELTESLEQWSYDDNSRPCKGGENDYSHAGDSLRYLAWGAMGGAKRSMARGLRNY